MSNTNGYDFSSKKKSIKELLDTPEYREYKSKKQKIQKRRETTYKFTSIGNSTDVIKYLIIINTIIFIISYYFIPSLIDKGAIYNISSPDFQPYQIITSMFLHGSIIHLLGNMLALWFTGNFIDKTISSKKFLILYFLSGISSSILCMFLSPVPAIGASGAISGAMIALLFLAPESKIFLFFAIPMKVKFFLYGFAAFSLVFGLLSMINPSLGFGIAHFGHLGGLIGGYLIMLYWKNKKQIHTY